MKKRIISSMLLLCMNATIFGNYATPILHATEMDEKTELFNYNDGEFAQVDVNYFEESIIESNIIDNGDGLQLNLSEFESSLLDGTDIEQVNNNIEYINNGLDTGILVYDENGDIVDAGGYESINGQAGQTKVVFTWKYIDVFFSSDILQGIIWAGSGYAGARCAALSAGSALTACLVAAGYVAGYLGSKVTSWYPRGIVIRVAAGKNAGFWGQ